MVPDNQHSEWGAGAIDSRLGQPKRQIQHVVLVIVRLGHLVVHLLVGDDKVACRACRGPPAGALDVQVVFLRNVEEVVAGVDEEGVWGAVFVDEGYFDTGGRSGTFG